MTPRTYAFRVNLRTRQGTLIRTVTETVCFDDIRPGDTTDTLGGVPFSIQHAGSTYHMRLPLPRGEFPQEGSTLTWDLQLPPRTVQEQTMSRDENGRIATTTHEIYQTH